MVIQNNWNEDVACVILTTVIVTIKPFATEVLEIYFVCLGWPEKNGVGDSEGRH